MSSENPEKENKVNVAEQMAFVAWCHVNKWSADFDSSDAWRSLPERETIVAIVEKMNELFSVSSADRHLRLVTYALSQEVDFLAKRIHASLLPENIYGIAFSERLANAKTVSHATSQAIVARCPIYRKVVDLLHDPATAAGMAGLIESTVLKSTWARLYVAKLAELAGTPDADQWQLLADVVGASLEQRMLAVLSVWDTTACMRPEDPKAEGVTHKDPWEEGAQALQENWAWETCPYAEGSSERRAWLRGYSGADREEVSMPEAVAWADRPPSIDEKEAVAAQLWQAAYPSRAPWVNMTDESKQEWMRLVSVAQGIVWPILSGKDQGVAVVQEGGATGEFYLHTFHEEAEAEAFRESSSEASYNTTGSISVPRYLAKDPNFQQVVQDILRSVGTEL